MCFTRRRDRSSYRAKLGTGPLEWVKMVQLSEEINCVHLLLISCLNIVLLVDAYV